MSADPEVLGSLLLLQGTLHVMPDLSGLAAFLSAGLGRVPGVAYVALCDRTSLQPVGDEAVMRQLEQGRSRCDCESDEDASQRIAIELRSSNVDTLPLRTARGHYGCLVCALDDEAAYGVYRPFVANVANQAALQLEVRAQHKTLRELHTELEARVVERTAELERANRSLAEREHFIRRVCDAAPMLIYIYDLVGQRAVYVNEAAQSLLGQTPEYYAELGSDLLPTLIHPDDLPSIRAHQDRLLEAGDHDRLEFAYRVRNARGGWSTLQSYESVFARDAEGQPTQTAGIAVDISERITAEKQRAALEEQMRHAQKIDSLGRLTGGIAHDFNNRLTPVITLAGMLLEKAPPGTELHDDLQEILEAGDSCRQLTQRLLAFGRKQVLRTGPRDLRLLVQRCASLLRRLLRENVALEVDSGPEPLWIDADPSQLEQVLVNLAINAQDAMPEGGTLRLQLITSVDDPTGSGVEERSGASAPPSVLPSVLLEVRDTGTGMPPNVIERAFEPFFTTKAPGHGTGLGLSMAQGIVAQHGGQLTLESELGQGSCFRLMLPLIAPPADQADTSAALTTATATGLSGSTVLVAEDDPGVRSLLRRALERLELRALIAEDGEQAIALAELHAGEIDLLLSDVVMPGLTGPQLYAQLLTRQPSLRVLFISGYADEVFRKHGIDPAKVSFLPKPFNFADLAARLSELLAGETPESPGSAD